MFMDMPIFLPIDHSASSSLSSLIGQKNANQNQFP